MTWLVVSEGGAVLTCHRERVQLRREGKLVHEVRLQELEGVLAVASLGLTAAAARRLLRAGVEVAFLDERGKILGRLSGPASGNVELRRTQLLRTEEPAFRLAVARRIVAAKLLNQRWLLLRYRRRRGTALVGGAAGKLRLLAERTRSAETVDELLGIEGAGAHEYFGVFGALVSNPLFSFGGRTRRPPKDPVNAMLSFGYAVVTSLAEGEAAGAGLDPMVGFLHALEYGRPSMALDLVEPFRPVAIDALVLRLVNKRQIAPADFGPAPTRDGGARPQDPWLDRPVAEETSGPGVYLARTGRQVLLRALMTHLRSAVTDTASGETLPLRELLRRSARSAALAVRQGDPSLFRPLTVG